MNCTDQMVPEYKFFANNQTTGNVLVFDIILSVDELLPKSQKLIKQKTAVLHMNENQRASFFSRDVSHYR